MNSSGLLISLTLFAGVVLIAVITVATMRFLARKCGVTELMNNGASITEDGIEYLGFLFFKKKNAFSEIESVELASYPDIFISMLLFRYGLNVRKVPPNFFSKYAVIRLKRANPYKYLFFTPKDAPNFVDQLRRLISKT